MSPTTNLPFTPQGVCEILDSCSKNGVRRISYHGLEVDFGRAEPTALPNLEQFVGADNQRPDSVSIPHEVLLENEQKLRRAQLETLRITDPEAFEDLIIQNELEAPSDVED